MKTKSIEIIGGVLILYCNIVFTFYIFKGKPSFPFLIFINGLSLLHIVGLFVSKKAGLKKYYFHQILACGLFVSGLAVKIAGIVPSDIVALYYTVLTIAYLGALVYLYNKKSRGKYEY